MCGEEEHCGLRKEIDLEDPTFCCTSRISGCTQRNEEVGHRVVQARKDLLRSITTTEVTDEKQQITTSSQMITAESYDMEEHAEKCFARDCDFAGTTMSAPMSAETPGMGDLPSSPDDFSCTGELAPTCAHILFTCLFLASMRICEEKDRER